MFSSKTLILIFLVILRHGKKSLICYISNPMTMIHEDMIFQRKKAFYCIVQGSESESESESEDGMFEDEYNDLESGNVCEHEYDVCEYE